MDWKVSTIIHIGYLQQGRDRIYLFLRKTDSQRYLWHVADPQTGLAGTDENHKEEFPTVIADSVEEAIRLASRKWNNPSWKSLGCGFRFTLPERDEIGTPALFHQMVLSHKVGNGVYLDEELGCSCIVRDAPSQTLLLWKQLEQGKAFTA